MSPPDQPLSGNPRDGNRLAVDIGGTFTDLVLEWEGRRFTGKRLTTHSAPARAVIDGVKELLSQANAKAEGIDLMLHGTTLATNALIERRGATTALLTTAGHRDALEMAAENRFEQYDVNIDRPVPLVPRHLRLPVRERVAADGDVLLPLDEASVHAAIDQLIKAHVESVAVGLLHAYINPEHEQQIAALVAQRMPQASITCSHDVCPEIREYERLSTCCANAYVKPLMGAYLADLAASLQGLGLRAPILLMTSGGGLTTLAAASDYPIRLVESGPAGGAQLAADLATRHAASSVLSFDMGGTTAKLCLLDDGEPQLSRAFEVDRSYRFKKGSGLPVRIPVIEMVEIGAGGGSIASLDALQRIQVGPQSAGSEPGPACYGRGGDQPTVTDCDLLLGRIPGQGFAGGAMTLNRAAAEQAITRLSKPLGSDARAAAFGVSAVVDENMAAASRAHAVEWGKSATNRLLIAFGGAAPLHAARLAQILRINKLLVPADAGVGSALGFLLAPVRFEVVRSRYQRLDSLDTQACITLIKQMRQEAEAVVADALGDAPREERVTAYMRYVGQGFEIAVDVPSHSLNAMALQAAFETTYEQLYGRTIPDQPMEVLSWTLSLGEQQRAPEPLADPIQNNERSTQDLDGQPVSFDGNTVVETVLLPRADLAPGDVAVGPLLVTEDNTCTVVPPGARIRVLADHALLVELDVPGSAPL